MIKKKDVIKKSKETVSKTIADVKKNPIALVYVVGGIVGVVVIYKVVKGLTSKVDKIFNGDSNIDDVVNGTGGKFANATITNQEATNYAQELLDAFNEQAPLYGTDEDVVEAVFTKIKNGDDFLRIFKAFGMKDYNGNNSPPTGFWSNLDSYSKRNLVYWLRKEIDPFWDKRLFKIVKEKVGNAGFAFA